MASSPLRACVRTKSSLLKVNSTTFWIVTLSSATRIRAPIGSSWGHRPSPPTGNRASSIIQPDATRSARPIRPRRLRQQRDRFLRRQHLRQIKPHQRVGRRRWPPRGCTPPGSRRPEAAGSTPRPAGRGSTRKTWSTTNPTTGSGPTPLSTRTAGCAGLGLRDAESFSQVHDREVPSPVLHHAFHVRRAARRLGRLAILDDLIDLVQLDRERLARQLEQDDLGRLRSRLPVLVLRGSCVTIPASARPATAPVNSRRTGRPLPSLPARPR